jgi:hypothetical protein
MFFSTKLIRQFRRQKKFRRGQIIKKYIVSKFMRGTCPPLPAHAASSSVTT